MVSVFHHLFDIDILKKEAFYMWKDSELYPKGKGVSLKLLTTFFSNLAAEISDEEDSPVDV